MYGCPPSIYVLSRERNMLMIPEDDQFSPPYILEVRPTSEFSYDAAKVKLVNLKIGSDISPQIKYVVPGDTASDNPYEAGNTGHQAKLLRLSAWMDMESRLTVRTSSLRPFPGYNATSC